MIRRCDGIGRRDGLKIRLPLSRADARNPLFYKGFQNFKNPILGLCPPKCPPISGKRSGQPQKTIEYAGVMELADVLDSKSSPGDRVRVRPPPPAPFRVFIREFTCEHSISLCGARFFVNRPGSSGPGFFMPRRYDAASAASGCGFSVKYSIATPCRVSSL